MITGRLNHLLLIFSVLLFSCNEEIINDASPKDDNTSEGINASEIKRDSLMLLFAKSFRQSMKQSSKLRVLVKQEALKQFNREYDVLYATIKDRKIEGNVCISELIEKNFGAQNCFLDELLKLEPTLTIHVPELPENTFSAELWNTDLVVPSVAVRSRITNDVTFVNAEDSIDVIEARYTPGFPILVLKTNERVVSRRKGTKQLREEKAGTVSYDAFDGRVFFDDGDVEFKFVDDYYDSNSRKNLRTSSSSRGDLLLKAYNLAFHSTDRFGGWQRDLIYYNISNYEPYNKKFGYSGEYTHEFEECITSFKLNSNHPDTAYQYIADQISGPKNDPSKVVDGDHTQKSHWTDGYFDFKVTFFIHSKNGLGNTFTVHFDAKGEDLFEFKLGKSSHRSGVYYAYEAVKLKTMKFNRPLFSWNLQEFPTSMKIRIEEVDLGEPQTKKEIARVKYATNFKLNPKSGRILKVGSGLGDSVEKETVEKFTYTYSDGSDSLGEAIMNFGDDYVIYHPLYSENRVEEEFRYKTYSSRYFDICIRPLPKN